MAVEGERLAALEELRVPLHMGDDEGHIVADHHGRPGGAVLEVLLGPVEGVESGLPVKEEGDRGVG